MTAEKWLTCGDPTAMVRGLAPATTQRQVRLLDCACCRRWEGLLTDEAARRALDAVERHADGRTGIHKLNAALRAAAPLLGRRPRADWTAELWLVQAICVATNVSPDRYSNDA